MKQNPYSANKLIYHPEKLLQIRNNEQPLPVHVLIVISDLCNQDCHFCAYRMSGYINNEVFSIIQPDGQVNRNPNRMIPYEKLQEILHDCKRMGVRAIQLSGGGEPTVHPQFGQYVSDILDADIDLGLVTNGLMLKEKDMDNLARSCWVRVSIDAGTPETYSKTRNVSKDHYKRVRENITKLAARDRKATLGIGFVVTKENYRELEDACRQYKEWGADYTRVGGFFQNEGSAYYSEIIDELTETCKRLEKLNDDGYTVYNNFQDRIDDLEQGSPDYGYCGIMNLTTYIGADLNVYTCCNNSYSKKGTIGSLKDQGFYDLWTGEEKRKMFAEFDPRSCEKCMYNNKNKSILSLVNMPSGHNNFI